MSVSDSRSRIDKSPPFLYDKNTVYHNNKHDTPKTIIIKWSYLCLINVLLQLSRITIKMQS